MAFATSFFTPNLAPAANGHEQDADHAQPADKDNGQPVPANDSAEHDVNMENGIMEKSASPASKTAAPKKKKGTAAAVKGPAKRARPSTGASGGAKKAKSGAPKKTKADTSKQPGAADAGDAADSGDSSESDNGPYCLCRGPDDHRFMIACDRCEDWFHGECIGMDKHTGENLVQKYICPNCTDGGRYATRYKKMCSLSTCTNPARIYDAARPSIFCSPEHCQAWWEQLVATLPKTRGPADPDYLTQEEFMGLLDAPFLSNPSSTNTKESSNGIWKPGKAPFEIPPNFWDLPLSSTALTPEEQTLLTTSAAARYQLGEEIVLCKKMLQLVDMALKRREAAVAAGKGTAKDLCGYDARLDSVGATHQFALFLHSPQGEAVFKAGRLDAADAITTTTATTNPNPNETQQQQQPTPADTFPPSSSPSSHMCSRRKCKPHNGWGALLAKGVRHDMKELAAQAKELLDAEQRVRDGAAGRFRRRLHERNGVVALGQVGFAASS